MCFFHVAQQESEVYAIALTGRLKGTKMLLIDYLAVRETNRKQGMGRRMVDFLMSWSKTELQCESIVIEVEAEHTAENLERIQFWKDCGFTLTEYIHHYKVVPEPYQAIFFKLVPDTDLDENGEELFPLIEQFHRASFRGA